MGWIGNLLIAFLLLDGVFHFLDLGWHLRLGLALATYLPLVYFLPYFSLIGLCSRLRNAAETSGSDALQARLALGLETKKRLFWPVLVAVLASLTGPILGFSQLAQWIPGPFHGVFMLAFAWIHAATWARALLSLQIAKGLTESL